MASRMFASASCSVIPLGPAAGETGAGDGIPLVRPVECNAVGHDPLDFAPATRVHDAGFQPTGGFIVTTASYNAAYEDYPIWLEKAL